MGKNPKFKTPVVESGGSSVGKRVCVKVLAQFIDIGNASSRMKASELEFCNKNGVDVTEIKVGYDGIAVANSLQGETLKISKADLGIALTAEVPACYKGSGRSNNCDEWITNPFKKWVTSIQVIQLLISAYMARLQHQVHGHLLLKW